jgi:hypothetical protein
LPNESPPTGLPPPEDAPVPEEVAAPEVPLLVLPLFDAGPVLLAELGLLVVPPPELPIPDVRLVDWQPATSTAARVKPSKVAGRILDVDAMKIPR